MLLPTRRKAINGEQPGYGTNVLLGNKEALLAPNFTLILSLHAWKRSRGKLDRTVVTTELLFSSKVINFMIISHGQINERICRDLTLRMTHSTTIAILFRY